MRAIAACDKICPSDFTDWWRR